MEQPHIYSISIITINTPKIELEDTLANHMIFSNPLQQSSLMKLWKNSKRTIVPHHKESSSFKKARINLTIIYLLQQYKYQKFLAQPSPNTHTIPTYSFLPSCDKIIETKQNRSYLFFIFRSICPCQDVPNKVCLCRVCINSLFRYSTISTIHR